VRLPQLLGDARIARRPTRRVSTRGWREDAPCSILEAQIVAALDQLDAELCALTRQTTTPALYARRCHIEARVDDLRRALADLAKTP